MRWIQHLQVISCLQYKRKKCNSLHSMLLTLHIAARKILLFFEIKSSKSFILQAWNEFNIFKLFPACSMKGKIAIYHIILLLFLHNAALKILLIFEITPSKSSILQLWNEFNIFKTFPACSMKRKIAIYYIACC